jgi:hypothetical protein
MMSQGRYWVRVNFRAKRDIYSKTRGHVLTPFFGKNKSKEDEKE